MMGMGWDVNEVIGMGWNVSEVLGMGGNWNDDVIPTHLYINAQNRTGTSRTSCQTTVLYQLPMKVKWTLMAEKCT